MSFVPLLALTTACFALGCAADESPAETSRHERSGVATQTGASTATSLTVAIQGQATAPPTAFELRDGNEFPLVATVAVSDPPTNPGDYHLSLRVRVIDHDTQAVVLDETQTAPLAGHVCSGCEWAVNTPWDGTDINTGELVEHGNYETEYVAAVVETAANTSVVRSVTSGWIYGVPAFVADLGPHDVPVSVTAGLDTTTFELDDVVTLHLDVVSSVTEDVNLDLVLAHAPHVVVGPATRTAPTTDALVADSFVSAATNASEHGYRSAVPAEDETNFEFELSVPASAVADHDVVPIHWRVVPAVSPVDVGWGALSGTIYLEHDGGELSEVDADTARQLLTGQAIEAQDTIAQNDVLGIVEVEPENAIVGIEISTVDPTSVTPGETNVRRAAMPFVSTLELLDLDTLQRPVILYTQDLVDAQVPSTQPKGAP